MMQLSNIIYKYSRRYDLDPKLMTAIFAQESMYKVGSKNCTKGIRCYRLQCGRGLECCDFIQAIDLATDKLAYHPVRTCTDFGISQIHYRTINRYKFNLSKLLSDTDYSVYAGARVLYDIKRRRAKKEPTWWTRYNASSPHKRAEYERKVMRFYPNNNDVKESQ